MPTPPATRAGHPGPRPRRIDVARLCLGTLLALGMVGCASTTTSSSSAAAQLGPSITLTNGGCTYAGSTSLTAEDAGIAIPVTNDSDFIAVVTLLRVGSAFDTVAADVDEYNDAESVGEPFELTLEPGVTAETEVRVDPAGVGELASDVSADTYAVMCLGAPSDNESEGLDEAFLFGPLDITE